MAPSLVQATPGNHANSGSTVTLTFGANTTAGNCIVVYVGAQQGTTNPTVSGITLGGAAGNFALAKKQNNNSDADCEIWVDQNCTGGQTSVVITFTAGTGVNQGNSAIAEEWSGIVTATPVDKTNGQDNSVAGGSWSSLSSGTLSQANELVVGAVCETLGNGITITGPSSPWANNSQVNAGAQAGLLSGNQVVSATTAQTYSGTFSPNAGYAAVIVTLKGATGAAGTAQPRATVPVPRRRPARGISQGVAVPGIIGTAPRQPPFMAVPPRRRPARAVISIFPHPGTVAPPPPPVSIPPAIPTSGGDRGYTIRVFREIRPGDVPGMGAQMHRPTGRAFLVPIPTDEEHATHAWETAEPELPAKPQAPPGPGKLELAAGKALDIGRIFADPPYERHRKTCGAIRKIGGTMLTCGRKPGHQGKHSDRGLDWR